MTPIANRLAGALLVALPLGAAAILLASERPSQATVIGPRMIEAEASGTNVIAAKAGDQSLAPRTLGWDDLVPDDVRARSSDPQRLMDTFIERGLAPADPAGFGAPRDDLAGVRVSLAGYMTPLFMEAGQTRAFLLVPYVGACVHVPAPPPNQIVLVESAEPVDVLEMWEPFSAVGTLRVESLDTGLAEVGYSMDLERIVPYEGDGQGLEGVRSAGDGD